MIVDIEYGSPCVNLKVPKTSYDTCKSCEHNRFAGKTFATCSTKIKNDDYERGLMDMYNSVMKKIDELIDRYGSIKVHDDIDRLIKEYRLMGYEDIKTYMEEEHERRKD